MKIGRNDPCPCGSGKKYKHCCMDKKIIPFPGASHLENVPNDKAPPQNRPEFHPPVFDEEDMARYREFCENLEPDEPIPSLREFLADEENTLESLSSLGLTPAEVNSCKNQKELQELVEQKMEAYNDRLNQINPEIGERMDLILEKGLWDAGEAVEINAKVPLKLLKKAPIIKILQIALNLAIKNGGSLPLDGPSEKPSSPPLWVETWANKWVRSLPVFFDLEDNFELPLFIPLINYARTLLVHLGFMTENEGKLQITAEGIDLAAGRKVRQAYDQILKTSTQEIDWFFIGDYPEEISCVSESFELLLFLTSLCDRGSHMEELDLFEMAMDSLSWEERTEMDEEELLNAFEDRFLNGYCLLMGFLEVVDAPEEDGEVIFEDSEWEYRVTDLYKELFHWKISELF